MAYYHGLSDLEADRGTFLLGLTAAQDVYVTQWPLQRHLAAARCVRRLLAWAFTPAWHIEQGLILIGAGRSHYRFHSPGWYSSDGSDFSTEASGWCYEYGARIGTYYTLWAFTSRPASRRATPSRCPTSILTGSHVNTTDGTVDTDDFRPTARIQGFGGIFSLELAAVMRATPPSPPRWRSPAARRAQLGAMDIDDLRIEYAPIAGKAVQRRRRGPEVQSWSNGLATRRQSASVGENASWHTRTSIDYRNASLTRLLRAGFWPRFVWGFEAADDLVKQNQSFISYRGRSFMIDGFLGWAWKLTSAWHVEEGILVGVGRTRWRQDFQ